MTLSVAKSLDPFQDIFVDILFSKWRHCRRMKDSKIILILLVRIY
jgi:hypothetical protein